MRDPRCFFSNIVNNVSIPLNPHLDKLQPYPFEKLRQLFAQVSGEWPVLCFDDLASEVDREHQARILSAIEAYRPQVLATATHEPSSFEQLGNRITRFHVEQGRVTRLL
jgi:hypothetical protein